MQHVSVARSHVLSEPQIFPNVLLGDGGALRGGGDSVTALLDADGERGATGGGAVGAGSGLAGVIVAAGIGLVEGWGPWRGGALHVADTSAANRTVPPTASALLESTMRPCITIDGA